MLNKDSVKEVLKFWLFILSTIALVTLYCIGILFLTSKYGVTAIIFALGFPTITFVSWQEYTNAEVHRVLRENNRRID